MDGNIYCSLDVRIIINKLDYNGKKIKGCYISWWYRK